MNKNDKKNENAAVIFIDSSQATDLSADGSSFTYRMSPPLSIPNNASPRLSVLEADLFYTSPNVSTAKNNNKLRFATWDAGQIAGATYLNNNYTEHEIAFADGLYALEDVRTIVIEYCESNPKLADSALDLTGINATQSVQVSYDAENSPKGLMIFWSDSNSIGKLLGFTSNDVVDLFTIATNSRQQHYNLIGDSVANFDAVQHFQLHLSVLSGSNYTADGKGGGQIACSITPDVAPGYQIRYRPIHPLPCEALALRGHSGTIHVRMTDNHGVNAVLREGYSARILVTW